jgi:replicative DNA helicase
VFCLMIYPASLLKRGRQRLSPPSPTPDKRKAQLRAGPGRKYCVNIKSSASPAGSPINLSLMVSASQEPPHCIEAEQAFLGAILINNEAADCASDFLKPTHFYENLHGRLYAAIMKLSADGKRATPVTLKPYFDDSDRVGNLTVFQYLGVLVSAATSVINAPHYARTIYEAAIRRGIVEIGEEIAQRARTADVEADPADLISLAEERLFELSSTRTSGKKQVQSSLGDAAEEAVRRMLSTDDESGRIPIGLVDLDAALGGWWPGELVIMGGRPSMGKSMVAVSLALRAARSGHGVMYFSHEMPYVTVAERCLTDILYNSQTPIPYTGIRSRGITQRDKDRVAEASAKLKNLPLIVDEQRGLTVVEIIRRARRQAQNFEREGQRLSLVVVDHIGLVRASDRYSGFRTHEVGEIVNELAILAKELWVPVLALQQLNRGPEGREEKRPSMADLRDSGNIEEHADTVIFPYRSEYYLERTKYDKKEFEDARLQKLAEKKNKLELIIGKQRNGPCKTVELFACAECNAVRDLAK